MKILITAFEPFGDSTENSAHLAMDLLPDCIGNHTLIKKTLPVVYGKSIIKLKEIVNQIKPQAVICLGQAAGTVSIRIERVAVNLDDTNAEDNEKNLHIDKTIIKDGDAAYFATLPTRKMMEASIAKSIPAHLSYTAGNYVCNHVMYGLLNYIKDTGIMGGFIHIPSTPAQAIDKSNHPSMSSSDAASGLVAMIEAM